MSRQVEDHTTSEAESWIFDALLVAFDGSKLDLDEVEEIEWGVHTALDATAPPLVSALMTTGSIVSNGDPKAGSVRVRVDADDHAAIVPGSYVHMCQVTMLSGIRVEQFWGNWIVTQSIFV